MPCPPLWTVKPITLATLPVPAWECLFGQNDTTLQDLSFCIWILRSGPYTVLIDAGLPSGIDLQELNQANQSIDPLCLFTPPRPLAEALHSEGLAPCDITHLLLSQLITYSTGGLNRANFPNAHVYAAWGGMHEFLTLKPNHPPRNFYLTPESWAYTRDLLVEDRLTFVDEPQGLVEIAPGLHFAATGGHHPGSAGVRIQTSHGILGILETAFIQENITQERPIGIAENAAQCRDVIRQWKQECTLVLASHEPGVELLLKQFFSADDTTLSNAPKK